MFEQKPGSSRQPAQQPAQQSAQRTVQQPTPQVAPPHLTPTNSRSAQSGSSPLNVSPPDLHPRDPAADLAHPALTTPGHTAPADESLLVQRHVTQPSLAEASSSAAAIEPHINVSRLQGTVTEHEFEPPAGVDVKVKLFVDSSVQNVAAKKKAIHDALAILQSKCPDALESLNSIDELPIYLGKDVPCEVVRTPDQPGGKPTLYLGDKEKVFSRNNVDPMQVKAIKKVVALKPGEKPLTKDTARIWANGENGRSRGVADQVYDDNRKLPVHPQRIADGETKYQASKLDAKAAAVVVHELGHIIHERMGGQGFWDSRKPDVPPVSASIAQQVSSYTQNKQPTELVAEVFTGLVHGKTYPQEVMSEYSKYWEHGAPPVNQN